MKGLLLKDIYTLFKQMKIFFIIVIVLPFIPSFSFSLFSIVYAALLPITTLAYDERSKWNSLAKMMPYSTNDIVMSKYLLGYIFMFAASALCLFAGLISKLLLGYSQESNSLVSVPVVMCIAVIMTAVNLPLMFKFGVEKGRLILVAVTTTIVIFSTLFSAIIDDTQLVGNSRPVIYIIGLSVTVIINIISISISKKIVSKN